ncbi:transglycosylase SLT domain-containing protein [Candidatus Saccharibacteria bacterium]|nr:MAG: transglycosylase SLT domain-containing protein [Candidatus Saccharibacteria bacterium]
MHNHQVGVVYNEAGITAPWLPKTVKHWQSTINQMGETYNIDPNFIAIIMTLESGGYRKADSGQAEGLMQITPATAQEIAKNISKLPKTIMTFGTLQPISNLVQPIWHIYEMNFVCPTKDRRGYKRPSSWPLDTMVALVLPIVYLPARAYATPKLSSIAETPSICGAKETRRQARPMIAG